jgi:hypothetical protein
MIGYKGLSDHTVFAALAARAIYCVEVSEVSVFFCKAHATRWELSEFYDLVILSLQFFCSKGELVASLLRTFPEFSQNIDAYVASQADQIKAVYKAAKAYDDQWPHFMARPCLTVLACVMEHRDACVKVRGPSHDYWFCDFLLHRIVFWGFERRSWQRQDHECDWGRRKD